MRDRISSWAAAAAARVRPLGEHAAAHRFWYECAALTLAILLAALLVGRSAQARAAALEARAAELEAVAAGIGGWRGALVAPTPAESTLWRDSEAALLRLARGNTDALTAASSVARRADEVGIYDLRIRMLSPDSLSPRPALAGGAWTVEAGRSAVEVRFLGDWASVINFLGSLPPQVEVGSLRVTGGADGLGVRARLLTREVLRQ